MKEKTSQADRPLMRDCHCFNLRRAALAVTALYDRHVEAAGVTIQQFCVLRHVRDWGPVSVTELSERIGLDRTTLSRNLALLERRGLLAVQPSPGRQRPMVLTADGKRRSNAPCFAGRRRRRKSRTASGRGRWSGWRSF